MNSNNSDEVEPDLEDVHGMTEQQQILQLNSVIYAHECTIKATQLLLNNLETKVSRLEAQMSQVGRLDIPRLQTELKSLEFRHEDRVNIHDRLIASLSDGIETLYKDSHDHQRQIDNHTTQLAVNDIHIGNILHTIDDINKSIVEIHDKLFDRSNYKEIKLK